MAIIKYGTGVIYGTGKLWGEIIALGGNLISVIMHHYRQQQ